MNTKIENAILVEVETHNEYNDVIKETFITAVVDGEKKYYVHGRAFDKDAGNAEFLRLKKIDKNCKVTKITEDNKDLAIKALESKIDRHVAYIEDYSQYNRALRKNKNLRNMINILEEAEW